MSATTPLTRRMRLMLTTLAVTASAMAALAIGGAATASAAGPDYLSTFDSVRYPTWAWGRSTRVCAYNHGRFWGHLYIDPVYGDSTNDQMWIASYTTNCITRSWWGNPIDIVNNGETPLTVWAD